MKKIGSNGGKAFHAKYKLSKLGINDFAIVDRMTGKPMPKTLCGVEIREYFNDKAKT